MTVKDQALKVIENQPSDTTIDDIIHEMKMIKAINHSVEQSDTNAVISHDEFKEKVKQWR